MFFRVLFPLMKSGYAVAGIFTFRIAWNEFILALLLTGRKTRTLPVAVSGFPHRHRGGVGRIMAMGTLIVIPPLIFTFFAARQNHRGIDRRLGEGVRNAGRRVSGRDERSPEFLTRRRTGAALVWSNLRPQPSTGERLKERAGDRANG